MTSVRPAVPEDAGLLRTVAREAYAHYVARLGREPAPMNADYERAIATRQVWVAEEHDRVVGLLVFQVSGDALELENVAVRPRARRRGVGSQLLETAERIAVERHLSRIRLYTNEAMTENLDLYRRHGYVETHRAEQDGYRRVFLEKTLLAQGK